MKWLNNRGDTIVEVLIAIVVLGAALGGAFAISNRSQRAQQDNHERYQAQLYANQQAELLRAGYGEFLTAGGTRSDFNTTNHVHRISASNPCFDPADGEAQSAASCTGWDGIYTVNVTDISGSGAESVNSGVSELTYSVTVTWDSIATGKQSQVELLYGL